MHTRTHAQTKYFPPLATFLESSPAFKALLVGFLPGLALLIFNAILPSILMAICTLQVLFHFVTPLFLIAIMWA
jgi:hypothetical protein